MDDYSDTISNENDDTGPAPSPQQHLRIRWLEWQGKYCQLGENFTIIVLFITVHRYSRVYTRYGAACVKI